MPERGGIVVDNQKATLLLVEDELIVAEDLKKTLLKLKYSVSDIIRRGEDVLSSVVKVMPDLIIMDIKLAGEMDGIEVAELLLQDYDIPIIFLTAHADDDTLDRAKLTSPFGYIIKPFDSKDLQSNIEMALYKHKTENTLKDNYQKLKKAITDIIRSIARTLESRDPYTAGHQKRVSHLAKTIAEDMKLPKDVVDGIYMAGVIHDFGKISVPAEILSKPSQLLDIEFELVKQHPLVGYEILKDIDFPWPVADIVHQHHERLDGSGYPQGLSGDSILLEARILAVADVVEAMASHRPYRSSLGIEKALEEIENNKNSLFDPEVVECCIRLFREKSYQFIEDDNGIPSSRYSRNN